jgi:hypothetical protein
MNGNSISVEPKVRNLCHLWFKSALIRLPAAGRYNPWTLFVKLDLISGSLRGAGGRRRTRKFIRVKECA